MKILAIDPGTTESAFVVWDGSKIEQAGIEPNAMLLALFYFPLAADLIACEMIASYGMPVGKEVFETVLFIGRLMERCDKEVELVYRKDVKLHHCNSPRAKDGNVRQAIIDRFGGKDAAIGKKASPGPLYGLKSHLWQAFAIALYIADKLSPEQPNQNQTKKP